MAELAAAKKIRATIKGSMTRMENYVNTIDDNADMLLDELKVRVDAVHKLKSQFEETEERIFRLDVNAETHAAEFEDKYYAVTAKLNHYISKLSISQGGNANVTMLNTTTQASTSTEIKLTKLSIPPFSGEYTEWPSFFDLYNASIHNKDYPAVQKFQYLRSLLKGEAAKLISYFSITDANYYEAYSKLVERYDRKKYIVNAFIKTFMDQPAITQVNRHVIRRLCDTSDEVLRGLRALDTKAEQRDCWLIYILVKKLDDETRMLWAEASISSQYPTISEFFEFLTRRCDALESVSVYSRGKPASQLRSLITEATTPTTNTSWDCPLCSGQKHLLHECAAFRNLALTKRKELIIRERRCFNCFHKGHNVYNCKGKSRCHSCKRKHNTLLHEDLDRAITKVETHVIKEEASKGQTSNSNSPSEQSKCLQIQNPYGAHTVLPTAIIRVTDSTGNKQLCRALLDSASQATFISESCVQRLGLKRASGHVMVSGLGEANLGTTRGIVQLECSPHNKDHPIFKIQSYVSTKITALQPVCKVDNSEIALFKTLELADPKFYECGSIDILLGVEVFFLILESQQIRYSTRLSAQYTKLGWVIGGRITNNSDSDVSSFCTNLNIDQALRQFWEIENISTAVNHTEEEQYCEVLFQNTTIRERDNKFVVQLPMRGEFSKLSSNYVVAERRLKTMERKFVQHPEFHKQYCQFMTEYETLGHMRQLNAEIDKNDYFFPHHGVIKEASTTTKLRVVFDASSKGINGTSFNDLMMVGPIIQSSLLEILLRFRQHKFVISGDVEKMYRQVWVNNNESRYQKILWRYKIDEPIRQFELRTLTYGTVPASFLSTRCLIQVAQECQSQYPVAAAAIMHDMYVDDLMTGASSELQLAEKRKNIVHILSSAGFNLRKWSTNSESLRSEIKDQSDDVAKTIAEDEGVVKLLGLKWVPNRDTFCFSVSFTGTRIHTKRTMLSEASRIFDPLGWLSPITVRVKILFQSLWLSNNGWDDNLPNNIITKWEGLRQELHEIEKLAIPRWLEIDDEAELHGFSDASELAYGAAVFIKEKTNPSKVHLVAGKTRVAPLRQISLPRLELMGALLLTELMSTIKKSFVHLKVNRIILWSDSKIVLDWLASHPRRWNTFVANRVASIIEEYPRALWRHVPSKQNAADCASRGVHVTEILDPKYIWWSGPEWLHLEEDSWPEQKPSYQTNVEVKSNSIDVLLNQGESFLAEFAKGYSSWEKTKRVLARVRRYIGNLKELTSRKNVKCEASESSRSSYNHIKLSEVQHAEVILIRNIQEVNFGQELRCLRASEQVPRSSPVKTLNPFLDKDGIIRVGGRIINADVNYQVKHPVILPPNNHVSRVIVNDMHLKWLHAGQGQLVGLIRQKYWIIRLKNIIRSVVHKCVKCIRYRPRLEEQTMGDLPPDRVKYTSAFINVGIDYCGPFRIHVVRRRGQIPIKAYVCIFVCLSTKAVHIELASDMSTGCFIAALKRFVARRGLCQNIYSDNGSNFVGANNNLKEIYVMLRQAEGEIANELTKNEIRWHFNPPAASHMGGLWESAVKTMKAHLKKVMGDTILTHEEFSTLLCQIEAIMNSRPICILSTEELSMLTPAHFLIGRTLTEVPEFNYAELKLSPLARWEVLTKMKQHFCRRWQRDYLSSLQRRNRWYSKSDNLNINDIVLVADERFPSTSWCLGRIMELYPGKDQRVRVASVKTANNLLRRPIHKLCKLPVHDVELIDSRRPECSANP